MGDYDRDRETVRESDRTTIITDGGERRGGGGILLAAVLIVALLVLLFLLFGGGLNRAADEVGVNVDVDAPEVAVPEVDLPDEVKVEVPETIEVKTDGDGNETK